LSHCVQTPPDLHLRPHTAEPIHQRSVTIAQVCSQVCSPPSYQLTAILCNQIMRESRTCAVCLLVSGSNEVPCHWRNSSGVQSLRTAFC